MGPSLRTFALVVGCSFEARIEGCLDACSLLKNQRDSTNKEVSALLLMLLRCMLLQHRVCYGLSEDRNPADFICGACHLKLMDPFYPPVS